jgi:hypothetical protein
MAGNYWGTDAPEAIAAALFDGRKDDYLGKVLYAPFADAPVSPAGVSWDLERSEQN